MLYDDDIPEGVAMDEAVEIAKTYGDNTSGAFVNAILTKVRENS
jgi:N utilization substance protein B